MEKTKFLKQLLFEPESTALDFKRDQYRFVGATNEEKSELLKDIMAFSNSFRRTTAYILIGVDEQMNGSAVVCGVETPLRDADIQQFVNSKVQKPIQFKCYTIQIDGKTVDVIEIPVQQRPIHLKKDFGGLKADKIYLRRGSSTGIATFDEIAQMGQTIDVVNGVDLNLEFGRDENVRAGDSIEVEIFSIYIEDEENIEDYCSNYSETMNAFLVRSHENINYWRELAYYWKTVSKRSNLRFCLVNQGNVTAQDILIRIFCPDSLAFSIDNPSPPVTSKRHRLFNRPALSFPSDTSASIEQEEGNIVATYSIKRIRPKEKVWTDDDLMVSCEKSGKFELKYEIIANNIQEPITGELDLSMIITPKELSLGDVYQLPRP